MNYYNPYFSFPYTNVATFNGGLFARLFGNGFSWSSLLSGTQKTLNVVNQAIPIVKQVSPVMKNAKTMFRIMNEFKKVDTPTSQNQSINSNPTEIENNNYSNTNEIQKDSTGPTFFI